MNSTAYRASLFPPLRQLCPDCAQNNALQGSLRIAASRRSYYSYGLTEELNRCLDQGRQLSGRGTRFFPSVQRQGLDIREAAKKLNARAVVEGSVRKSGDRPRISTRLDNAADGYHLWSQTYESELKDIFAIQEEITRSVVNALTLRPGVDFEWLSEAFRVRDPCRSG